MKNEHLVPVVVQDIVTKLNDKTIRENERANLILRVEAIRDYCERVLNNENRTTNR